MPYLISLNFGQCHAKTLLFPFGILLLVKASETASCPVWGTKKASTQRMKSFAAQST